MESFFSISELCIADGSISQSVADKLLKYHIVPMNGIRKQLGAPIWASQKSGYRPRSWEWARGRSGNSEHTFKGKGAVDWTTMPMHMYRLQELLFAYTDYTRICAYYTDNSSKPSFFHCDYKDTANKKRHYYYNSVSGWVYVQEIV